MRRYTLVAVVLAACSGPPDERQRLTNSAGKDDSISLRVKLTDSNPVVGFTLFCDQPAGCDGFVRVKVRSPEPCALFPTEPRCGIGRTTPLRRDVATTTIVTSTEGERRLPVRIESGDGEQWTTDIAAAFTGRGEEDLEVTLEKIAGTPDLTIEVRAEWTNAIDPGAEVAAVKTFLATVPGLTFEETSTQYAGYRAFALQYEQPIDHDNPAAGTFKQSAVLHHRVKDAPMILYTSGYSLFALDYLSELGVGLEANHVSTEQRWFGTSAPAAGITPESWQYVNIAQAAKDHHRLVTALKPFYAAPWLSTGHSKGGMTSIFHRRFFPDDVAATVAYVAPISFADPDPRYVPFLDRIGEESCRTTIRGVQKRALERFDQLLPMAVADAAGQTFERAGGQASAFEKSIVMLEWIFWQNYPVEYCALYFPAVPEDDASLYNLVASFVGSGYPDSALDDSMAYYYQAETQLGKQAFSTTHLAGLLKHEATPFDWSPAGTNPVHDPEPMQDIQDWVKTQADGILFLYGEYDPWSGGAYDIATNPKLVKVVAPKQPHAAMIDNLTPTDRDLVLRTIESWIGKRPNIGMPGVTPRRPAQPWMHP